MKMSKKFDQFMSAEYTVVFALVLSIICAVLTHILGMREFVLKYFIYETVIALAAAWLAVSVLPIFPLGNTLATSIMRKEPPSRAYMFFMSCGICSLMIPAICLVMCSLIVGYENDLSWTAIWNGFLVFAGPVYVICVILVQVLGKPLFMVAVHFLGDEAFEKRDAEQSVQAEEVFQDIPDEADTSVETGGDAHGDWEVINQSPVGKNTLLMHLEQRGTRLYGTLDYEGKTAYIHKGTFENGNFRFEVTLIMSFGTMPAIMEGTITGGVLKGTSLMDGRTTPLNGRKN